MQLKHVKENEKASHGSITPSSPTGAAHCAISSTVAVTIKQKASGANATDDAYVLCMHMQELNGPVGGDGGQGEDG